MVPNKAWRSIRVGVGVALVGFSSFGVGCREATQIVLSIHTNLDCHDPSWRGVAVYTGAPGSDVEQKNAATVVSLDCRDNGEIGDLVLVPSGENDAQLGIRVVAGIGLKPEDCESASYSGCIVARLAPRFLPHQSVSATLDLTGDCVGLACDYTHSCVSGVCVATGATAIKSGTVRCGDNGARCGTSGLLCCLHVDSAHGTTHGDCRDPQDCPNEDAVLQCDDQSECPGTDDAGLPNVCCLSYLKRLESDNNHVPGTVYGSHCLPQSACGVWNTDINLCQHRQGCVNPNRDCYAADEALPGYFYCAIGPW